MGNPRIMYVCTLCADNYPEGCGHFERTDLALMPNGDWLCENCWDDLPGRQKWTREEDNRGFSDYPSPPEYLPPSHQGPQP